MVRVYFTSIKPSPFSLLREKKIVSLLTRHMGNEGGTPTGFHL